MSKNTSAHPLQRTGDVSPLPTPHTPHPQPTRILGVDPGYDRCGFAVIEKDEAGKERLVHSQCFTTDVSLPFTDRLHALGQEFEYLLAHYTPSQCAIEKLYFTKNQKTAMRVAEVRGALIYLATRVGTMVREYGPNEVKVAITGSGRATKQQIMLMVPRLIRVDRSIEHDDEFDAIAIALTASAISVAYATG